MDDPKPSAEDKAREERWQAESDLRTLAEADAIRKDRKRITRARRFAAEQVKAVGAETPLNRRPG